MPREDSILRFLGVAIPEKKRRLLNLAPSINRVHFLIDDVFPCTTPRQRIYITDVCRFLLGSESLSVQGIHYGGEVQSRVDACEDRLKTDLAGNAFHTGCCGAAMLATLVPVAHADARARVRAREAAGGGDGGSDESDEGGEEVDDGQGVLEEIWQG